MGIRKRLRRLVAAKKATPVTHRSQIDALAEAGTEREWRQIAMYAEVMLQIRGVPGDIMEFGVSSGASFKSFVRLAEVLNVYEHPVAKRRVIGFDSFEGLPDLLPEDASSEGWKQPGEMRKGGYSAESFYDEVLAFCERHPIAAIEKGWFSESINRFMAGNEHTAVALLHIDCDLYESTRDALAPFLRRIPPSGVILFDEIFHPQYPGETKAFWDEFEGMQGFEFVRVGAMPWKWYLRKL
jgi:hypothetical protein